MRRETQNILLVLLGGALLKISLNGTFVRYVRPDLKPLLIVSGAVMLALAAVSIVQDIRRARQLAAAEAESAGHEHGAAEPVGACEAHGHQHGGARSAWMLLLPVLAIFLIAPPALGADSVNRSGDLTVASQQRQDQVVKTSFPPLPAGDVLPMRLADVATRAAWDATNSLDGRTLQLTGFVVREGSEVYVARLVINCCAADAMPVKAKLLGADLGALANDQWITVTGQVKPGSADQASNYVPAFTVTGLKRVDTPSDPYET
ncbi:TIGR03943 family protein [Kutzneria viridogrisea]|uniref:TIGR03943 family protein n=2 Tax=Kutzneria TaxID=43356 RepID=W5W2J3_9PSEU|nr:TIGR03943 family protein [Kutzneria albida]AHH95082.1 hypothetical protein KALB_1711 [Kutzneria albida DSM 43870]MBA8927561.1 putative repeat protein (TIGR03943 family) [Kutzneria viridogrisea]